MPTDPHPDPAPGRQDDPSPPSLRRASGAGRAPKAARGPSVGALRSGDLARPATSRPDAVPAVSVLIPVRDEAGNIGAVVEEILGALEGRLAFEILAVDDGSRDATAEALARLVARHPRLRVLRHDRAAGKSAAIHNAALAARAPIACTIDGDGQNPAVEILRLIAPLLDGEGAGLVAGQRRVRRDGAPKRLASRAANALRGWALSDGTRDTACGLKAFRRDAFLALPYFDNMHRFLPALFRAQGWEVRLIEVDDRPRLSGRSKYTNLGRAWAGAIDLLGVMWLLHRGKRARVAAPAASATVGVAASPAPLRATPQAAPAAQAAAPLGPALGPILGPVLSPALGPAPLGAPTAGRAAR